MHEVSSILNSDINFSRVLFNFKVCFDLFQCPNHLFPSLKSRFGLEVGDVTVMIRVRKIRGKVRLQLN